MNIIGMISVGLAIIALLITLIQTRQSVTQTKRLETHSATLNTGQK